MQNYLRPTLISISSSHLSFSAAQAPGKVSITEHSPLLFQPEPSLAPSSISSHSLIERSEKATEIPGAYFASYNVPSDREIYDYLGFGLKVSYWRRGRRCETDGKDNRVRQDIFQDNDRNQPGNRTRSISSTPWNAIQALLASACLVRGK